MIKPRGAKYRTRPRRNRFRSCRPRCQLRPSIISRKLSSYPVRIGHRQVLPAREVSERDSILLQVGMSRGDIESLDPAAIVVHPYVLSLVQRDVAAPQREVPP